MIFLASLPAFRHVTQRLLPRHLTPAQIVERINRIHGNAANGTIHDKVVALWKMEALGARLGMLGEAGLGPEAIIGSGCAGPEIVMVGYGAGEVAARGFNAEYLQYLFGAKVFPEEIAYAWEGVGHMLALQYFPLHRWLLGLPKVVCNWRGGPEANRTFFELWANDRVKYGYQRMMYLCLGRKEWLNRGGAQFAHAMIRHREWGKLYLRAEGTGFEEKPLPGEAAAKEFLNKVWPDGGEGRR